MTAYFSALRCHDTDPKHPMPVVSNLDLDIATKETDDRLRLENRVFWESEGMITNGCPYDPGASPLDECPEVTGENRKALLFNIASVKHELRLNFEHIVNRTGPRETV